MSLWVLAIKSQFPTSFHKKEPERAEEPSRKGDLKKKNSLTTLFIFLFYSNPEFVYIWSTNHFAAIQIFVTCRLITSLSNTLWTKQWTPQNWEPSTAPARRKLITLVAEMQCSSQLWDKTKYGLCATKGTETDQCKNPEGLCVGKMEKYLTWPEQAGIFKRQREGHMRKGSQGGSERKDCWD